MQANACIHIQVSPRPRICTRCSDEQLSDLRDSLLQLNEVLKIRRAQVEEALGDGTKRDTTMNDYMRAEILRDSVSTCRRRVESMRNLASELRGSVETKRLEIVRLRYVHSHLFSHSVSDVLKSREKKFATRMEPSSLAFEKYLRDPGRFDRALSSMHPFRKLRSVAQSLAEERKAACKKLLSMLRFRQITMDGGTQLVPELSDDPVVVSMTVFLLIALSRVLDIWLPFPVVLGTLSSSPCLHSPYSVYETGSVAAYPRILHSYKRVILPVTGDATLTCYALFLEDLKYLAWTVDQGVLPGILDPLQMINQIISSPNLGREIANPLQRSFPSSPSLSSSYSPSYRRSVIEQSVTEGGEWTLLDQL